MSLASTIGPLNCFTNGKSNKMALLINSSNLFLILSYAIDITGQLQCWLDFRFLYRAINILVIQYSVTW